MVVEGPTRPALPEGQETLEALDALIEEARRRARRRRRRAAAAALVVAGLGAGAFFLVRGYGSSEAPSLAQPAPSVRVGPVRLLHNGELTIMDYSENAEDPSLYGGRRGWYGLSTIDRGGELRPLVRCPSALDWCGWVVSADWAPEGRHLALSVTSLSTPNPNGIHIIDTQTGTDRHLGGGFYARDLDWSPDGLRLAYSDRGLVHLIDTTGGGRRVLGPGVSPSWSPDGKWIVYATRRVLSDSAVVYIIRPDGTANRLIKRRAAAPAWSPLGDVIAYRSSCGINLMTPQGRDATPPSAFKCNAIGVRGTPVWSPDGKKLAIGAGHIGANLPLGTFVMNADGSNLVRVSTKARGNAGFGQPRPAWRPRG